MVLDELDCSAFLTSETTFPAMYSSLYFEPIGDWVFRRLIGKAQVGGSLNPGSIAPIFKRVAQWIGMPERYVDRVSGHSTRVGATQDLAVLDIDLAAITEAGGWKSTRMPLQYAEKINAARSGMARAAETAGRNW
jgi:hypothetical protein